MANEAWRFFGNSLSDVYTLLGTSCQVTLTNGRHYSGSLYNVDPETRSILLLQPLTAKESTEPTAASNTTPITPGSSESKAQAKWRMIFVRNHAIKEFRSEDPTGGLTLGLEEMDVLAHAVPRWEDPGEVAARKERLKRIPVESKEDDSVVHIMTFAAVHPPYVPASIVCSNDVVRDRVESMLQGLDSAQPVLD
ncbi:hypothetical protein BGW38_009688 [Lunasporangiospora selenospora]|uniref:Uncharacterized protein n=1 Tax=Lunasporangiospora selenospora TaxID=979761 RepID=A0A9P6FXI2_9FUNG|nr:hypothetical protein BGW38_009688 [Lunasporangiospora selenospora]